MGLFDAFKCKYKECNQALGSTSALLPLPPNVSEPTIQAYAHMTQIMNPTTMVIPEAEDWSYLKRICGTSDYDTLAEVLAKTASTIKRLRGDKE